MAETRQLVTSGPYRFVRHPLYAAEEIAMLDLFHVVRIDMDGPAPCGADRFPVAAHAQ
jgi:Isoprenylcysteine carboxyl methyltransferase (ICMT) family